MPYSVATLLTNAFDVAGYYAVRNILHALSFLNDGLLAFVDSPKHIPKKQLVHPYTSKTYGSSSLVEVARCSFIVVSSTSISYPGIKLYSESLIHSFVQTRSRFPSFVAIIFCY